MLDLLQMWALVEILGLCLLPLTVTVFHNVPDRGWAFSKTIGFALFAFCTWFPLMCLQWLPYSRLFILGILCILLACGLLGFRRTWSAISKTVRQNVTYIIATEFIFFGMVFLLGFLRAFRPDIRGWEMFMDEGFIAAIMRSPHMPPNDMWFSGYSINYYYYAHYAIATLAKLLGQAPSIAFNTGISLYFGLAAVNLFGVTSNIVAWARHQRIEQAQARSLSRSDESSEENAEPQTVAPVFAAVRSTLNSAIPFGLVSMLMGLVLGNLAATQDWFLNHGEQAHYDWFGPSRVIANTINEFPAFSFLLSCFHAHVLTFAFTILSIGLAFNLLLEKDGKGFFAFGRGWRLPCTLLVTAMILGGLFTMNGWDFPTYLGLAILCIAIQHWLAYQRRINVGFLIDLGLAAIGLLALSLLLYLPFYLSFISPSQGIGLLGAKDRSPLTQEFLIYGLFLFVFLSLLVVSAWRQPLFATAKSAENSTVVATGDAGDTAETKNAENIDAENARDVKEAGADAGVPGWLPQLPIGLFPLIGATLVLADILLLVFMPNSLTFVVMMTLAVIGAALALYHVKDRSLAFILLLGALAFALVAVCEVVYLRDAFDNSIYLRMNTVFKFYFQSWAMLSVACGAGFFFLFERFWTVNVSALADRILHRSWRVVWLAVLLLFLVACMAYPLSAPTARLVRYDQLNQEMRLIPGTSLDGLTYLQNCHPPDSSPDLDSDPFPFCQYDVTGDYEAIRWLNANIQGDPIIVEAYKDDYSLYSRVSAFTGLPTLMGWSGHEVQWRMGWLKNSANAASFNQRLADIDTIYTSASNQQVVDIMRHYNAQYLYVGPMEHVKYTTADLTRFARFMQVVYQAKGVTIYKLNS